ncbi:hypothetical protein [Streptomyces fuscichromogenes]|uniref:hypothetical protein n=1 Tax=Streptomyces fuscichromogenes TaxID=1324013 RepID=UPI001E5FD446|nr:hypothetical protein [Streptomyces fuscichromogenes]
MNHGPDEKGPEGAGQGPDGLRNGLGAGFGAGAGAGADGREADDGLDALDGLHALDGLDGLHALDGLDGLDADELALRRLLHSAVDDVTPRDGVLDHLRRAVPARRARKRQAAVGMAAAALFIGTAIPALIHVSNSGGADPNTSMAGQASQAQGGSAGGKNPDGGASTAGGNSGQATGQNPGGAKGGGKNETTGAGDGTKVVPTDSAASSSPVCTSAQLGTPTSTVDAPDSTGVVYGTFRVVNVSATSCTVGGPGSVGLLAQGAADATKINAIRHASGDAAAGLPDPTTELTGLVLAPGAAYEEKFGFVPSETCPTSGSSTGGTDTGGTGGSTASPSPSEGASSSAGTTTSGTDGITTQLFTEDGTADGSIAVSYTPQAGSPTGSATVTNACAGTVYWTGVLPGV